MLEAYGVNGAQSILSATMLLGAITIGDSATGLLFLIGWIWLMVMAFQGKDWWWGLIVLFIPGIGGIIYGAIHWPGTKVPLILLILGVVLSGGVRFGGF